MDPLAAELRTLAEWLGLESVAVGRRGNLAQGIAARGRGPSTRASIIPNLMRLSLSKAGCYRRARFWCFAPGPAAATARAIDLNQGWRILQDVHGTGEEHGFLRRDWNPVGINPEISPWEPFQAGAFATAVRAPALFRPRATLFQSGTLVVQAGVSDSPVCTGPRCVSKAWRLLRQGVAQRKTAGWEHRGLCRPFEFEVGDTLSATVPIVLVVKVWSPWDHAVAKEHGEKERAFGVVRNLIKGTYEHADTFVQRDVNPVGIWRPVPPDAARRLALRRKPGDREPGDGQRQQCDVSVTWPVALDDERREAQLSVRILSAPDGTLVGKTRGTFRSQPGQNRLEASVAVPSPKLWSTWDRGVPSLYWAELELRDNRRRHHLTHSLWNSRRGVEAQ